MRKRKTAFPIGWCSAAPVFGEEVSVPLETIKSWKKAAYLALELSRERNKFIPQKCVSNILATLQCFP